MNSHQRRTFRRTIDELLPPGTLVVERKTGEIGRVVKRRRFDRADWNCVMVEAEIKPFGYSAVQVSRLALLKDDE